MALQLRYEVLRKPLGLQFTEAELKKDEHDTHIGLFDTGECVATLTLTNLPEGVKMRQVAVADAWQGKKIGQELCLFAEQHARQNGARRIFCHARKTAVPFYQKLHYRICSEEFTEVGLPHYAMEKQL